MPKTKKRKTKHLSVTYDRYGKMLFEYADEFEPGKTYLSYYGRL